MSAITTPSEPKSTWATKNASPAPFGIGLSQVTTLVPAACAASASLNQNSAIVWSYHCEPSTWYSPESALPLTV